MKCVFLTAPGECLEGAAELKELGYAVQSYPTSQEVEKLDDSRYDEFTRFLGYHPESRDRPYVRSLRISFASMLRDPAFADDDFIIFGESDSTPIVPADQLRPVLEEMMQKHPEIDIFRPFYSISWAPSNPPTAKINFVPFATSNHALNDPHVWGTHALVIPVAKREKVARIFSTYRLPIDTALEAASSLGELKMLVANHNCFYQKPRTCFVDKSTMYSSRNRKMALCLSSYKRFEDLQRQIYSIMHQSYRDFHLFVAVKGISTFIFQSILVPQFQEFMDAGRLTLRCFPNKNQLSNLLDTIRGLDISEYELFLKIDDDDFYGRDYLKTINDFHAEIPQHHCSYFSDSGWMHYKYGGISSLQLEYYHVFGATMALTPPVMQRLMECEANPGLISQTMKKWWGENAGSNIGFIEDNFIDKLMIENGRSNIAPFIRKNQITHHIIVQKANASVTRGDMLNGDFQAANTSISRDRVNFEYVLGMRHPQWHDSFRVMGNRGYRVTNGDAAEVISHTAEELVVKWDRWGRERYVIQPDGAYVFQKQPE